MLQNNSPPARETRREQRRPRSPVTLVLVQHTANNSDCVRRLPKKTTSCPPHQPDNYEIPLCFSSRTKRIAWGETGHHGYTRKTFARLQELVETGAVAFALALTNSSTAAASAFSGLETQRTRRKTIPCPTPPPNPEKRVCSFAIAGDVVRHTVYSVGQAVQTTRSAAGGKWPRAVATTGRPVNASWCRAKTRFC